MKMMLLTIACMLCACSSNGARTQHEPKDEASRPLVAYFSATGNTARAARILAEQVGGDLCEIVPEKRYTAADLDWTNHNSRSYVEMHNLDRRPAIKNTADDTAQRDTIYLGYPIWWDLAPTVVNTFIEKCQLKGKTVVPFATSGGSTIDNSVEQLRKTYPDIDWQEGRLLNDL